MESDFDKIYKLMVFTLNVTRLHPKIKRDKIWLLQVFSTFVLAIPMYCIIIYNIINNNLKHKDFLQCCKSCAMVIACQMAIIHFVILVVHQNSVLNLIKDISRDYEISKTLIPDEVAIVKKYISLGQRVTKQWFFISFMGTAQYIVKSISLQIYYYCVENEYRLIPPYDLIYPSIVVEENKNNFVVYLILYTWVIFYGSCVSVMFAAYAPLGPIMMLHACGQLEIARKRIDTLFVELDDKIIQEKLKTIIEHLQYIYSFVDRITLVFHMGYEITLKFAPIILPFTFYALTEAAKQGEISVEVIIYMIGSLLITATPCYYSDLLQERGEDIRIALYSCGWEQHYDRRTRKTLLIMLQYALRPVAIKTLFRSLCLDVLTDLFHQSYAIFNLINAMWE